MAGSLLGHEVAAYFFFAAGFLAAGFLAEVAFLAGAAFLVVALVGLTPAALARTAACFFRRAALFL